MASIVTVLPLGFSSIGFPRSTLKHTFKSASNAPIGSSQKAAKVRPSVFPKAPTSSGDGSNGSKGAGAHMPAVTQATTMRLNS
jgi:hypothetical protein